MTVVDWWGVTSRKANSRFLTTVYAGGLYDLLTDRLPGVP
jgi:inosine-uridine nucleoside N-ribohydrolase